MTFDLSPEQVTRRERAREVAIRTLAPAAADIDATANVPSAVLDELGSLGIWDGDLLSAVLVVEELATASASAAARAALDVTGAPSGLAGLRGVPRVALPGARQCLVIGAVCLGIGRAALAVAIDAARRRGDRAAGDPADPPHWALADAATDLDAARLLLQASAAGGGAGAAAAVVQAADAAARVVDASLRIVGPDGYRPGSALERMARDARAACLVLGTEDELRRLAADELLA